MSEKNEPSLQELEANLRDQAADADAQGLTIEEATPIDENSGESADPAKSENEDKNIETNQASEDGDNNVDAQDSDQPENGDEDGDGKPSKDDTQSAESSDSQTPLKKTKAEKDAERKDRSWKKLEEEKSKFLREKAEWEAQKLQNNNLQQPLAPDQLASEFEKLAVEFENEGDFDKADEARSKAKQLRSIQGAQGDASGTRDNLSNNPQFKVAWQANVERAINDFPEMQDVNSDFGKTVQALLRAPDMADFFSKRPDGAYIAAQLTQMKMTAQRVPILEKKIAALEDENKKLRQGMNIPDSGASSRVGAARSFESMSLKEQENYLRTQAERDDASNRPNVY